jgi:hypothetical protein
MEGLTPEPHSSNISNKRLREAGLGEAAHSILLPNQALLNRREHIVEPLFCTIHFRFVKLNLGL